MTSETSTNIDDYPIFSYIFPYVPIKSRLSHSDSSFDHGKIYENIGHIMIIIPFVTIFSHDL